MMAAPDDDLITVQDFANRYRVDAAMVRAWIKRGAIPYELVGPRKMRLRPGAVLKPIEPSAIVGTFADYPLSDDYMRMKGASNGQDRQGRSGEGEQDRVREGSHPEGGGGGSQAQAGRADVGAGRLAPLPKIKGRSGRTS